MSKLNLSTKEAIKEVENLTIVLKGLREDLAKMKATASTTSKQTAAALGRIADASDELYKAKDRLIKARAAEKASLKEELTAYEKLQVAKKQQLKILQDLIAQNKASSAEVKEAAASYKKLDSQIQKVNNTIKTKTAGAYDVLVNKTRLAKEALQNLLTTNRAGEATLNRAKNKYTSLANQLDKVKANIKGLTAAEKIETQQVSKKITAYDRLYKNLAKSKKAMYSARIEQGKNSKEARKATREYKKLERQMRKVRGETTGLTKGFKKFLPSLASVAGALGFAGIIYSMVGFVKQTITTIKTLDSLRLAVTFTGKSIFEISQSTIFITQLISKFGVELVSTTNRWIKFRAAAKQSGLTLKETQDIFRSMTKAGVTLGLKTDELRGIYLALEQMLSKGKVTTEELRRQLGERLPGAMGILAASMNKTIPELDKMLKKGEVLSAEVLPRFADAVEVAFGVESTETINTFQSALGRLEGAWQTFIDKVINDEGRAAGFFTTLLNMTTSVVSYVTKANASTPSLIEIFTAEEQDKVRLRQDAKAVVDAEKETGLKVADLKADLKAKEDAIKDKQRQENLQLRKATTDEEAEAIKKANDAEFDLLEEAQRKSFKALLDFNEDVDAERRKNAQLSLDTAKKNIKDLEEYFNPADTADGLSVFSTAEVDRAKELTVTVGNYTGKVEDLAEHYARLLAIINDAQLALEKGFGTRVRDEETTGTKKKLKEYKEYIDTQLQLDIDRLKALERRKQEELDLERVTFTERRIIADEIKALNEEIAKKERDLAIETAKLKRDNALASVKKDYALEKDKAKERKRINDEFRVAEEKAQLVHVGVIQDIFQNHSDELEAIKKASETLDIDSLIRENNLKIGEHKRALAAVEGFEKEQVKLRKALSDEIRKIEVENANLQTQAMILLLEAKLALAKEDSGGEINPLITRLENTIAELKANFKIFKEKGDEARDEDLIGWQEYLDAVGEIHATLGDIIDNVHQQRIDNIEAQILAEEYKYDKLIQLAEGDEKAQAALQNQREDRIRALEKRQLKERQKQAKAAKAFAIFEIGVNTALGISKALATFPPPASFIMAALVGALGVAQTIAVATKPIPKYAKGGRSPRDEYGIINDAGKKEYIERDGKILSTNQANAIVPLKAGDIIHKDYDTLHRKSLLLNGTSNGQDLSERDFSMFFDGIEKTLEKGLEKVKINNINKIAQPKVIIVDNESRWN